MTRRATKDEPSLFGVEPTTGTRPVRATPPSPPAPSKPPAPALFVASTKITTRANGRFSVRGREFDSIQAAQAWIDDGFPHPIDGVKP